MAPDLSLLWLVPPPRAGASPKDSPGETGPADLVEAVRLSSEGKWTEALAKASSPPLATGELAGYALYYAGLARLGLEQPEQARQAFAALRARQPEGYLAEASTIKAAEAASALGLHLEAAALYEGLSESKTSAPDEVWLALARSALAAGDRDRAARAYLTLYGEFPTSGLAAIAGTELTQLGDLPAVGDPATRFRRDLARAERLFDARRYAEARAAFTALGAALAPKDEADLVGLRLAQCHLHLRRYRDARDGARPYTERSSRRDEALFVYLSSLAGLGQTQEYLRQVRRLVDEFPASAWAEEALNQLATHFIRGDQDDEADETFRELYVRFPRGRHAERAAWQVGWRAYREGRYRDTVRIFDEAASTFPRADTRPAWLYWSGMAWQRLDDRRSADARFQLAILDYRNSYYGRLAAQRLAGRPDAVATAAPPVSPAEQGPALPPTAALIRRLISLELYDLALDELNYAERAWGATPVTRATLAWVYNRQGDLRQGINTMRRAYRQFIAAGGENLPREILEVIFPVDYWQEIRQEAARHGLDPCLIAALIAQESTFGANARSAANAIGLMQIRPATGRASARSAGIRRFSTAMLRQPAINLRLGTLHFARLVSRFGSVHLALASYNAGESRIVRWLAERPGLDRDEFIDDIPFPETRNYVKRIMGTADDYRALYGAGTSAAPSTAKKSPAVQKAAEKPTAEKAARRPAQKPAAQKVVRKPAQKPAAQKAAKPAGQKAAQKPAAKSGAKKPAAQKGAPKPAGGTL